jgi:hypothetical protein
MLGSDGSVTFDAREAEGWPYLAGWKPEVVDTVVLAIPLIDGVADPERNDWDFHDFPWTNFHSSPPSLATAGWV